MKTVALGSKKVGPGKPCYLIAEIGGNFDTLEKGLALVDLAAASGMDAVKLQTFRAETLTSKKAVFEMENTGRVSQYEHFKKYELNRADHKAISARAADRGLFFFSTPSHSTDADMLEALGSQAYKIGSDDAVNLPLLKHVARKKKPVLLSTGMCTMEEVDAAVAAIVAEGNKQIILFHCTTNYPTHPVNANLRAMPAMQSRFDFPIGYSDHTLGIEACCAAAALGAPILEFHFTNDKNGSGPDHMLSKDAADAAELARRTRLLAALLGDGIKRPAPSEATSLRNNRKSLVLTRDVKAGEAITEKNMEPKRPGTGIGCLHYYEVLGRAAKHDLRADDTLAWEDLK